MDEEALRQFLYAESQKPFSGWDFSYLDYRWVSAPLDWSYPSLLLKAIPQARSMLDMGTGGGEFLSRLRPLPPFACATEGYRPNLPIARQRLEPLGVQVFAVEEDDHLPFAENQFDLITNRHESYAPAELFRILAPGGHFITQQVGDENDNGLNELLGCPPQPGDPPWNLEFAVEQLRLAGFQILAAHECWPICRVFDVGAVVYYLKAIPWQVPDFEIEKYFKPLADLHAKIEAEGYLEIREHRFLVKAQKPAAFE
jgi:SAM-dependent methyltransferase